LFRISRLSDDQDFRAYSTGDARWFQRLHEKDIKGSYTDSRIEVRRRREYNRKGQLKSKQNLLLTFGADFSPRLATLI